MVFSERVSRARHVHGVLCVKGVVVDIWAKVSLVGIELLSVEARIVIASVETYLKYAEAIGLTATAAAPA